MVNFKLSCETNATFCIYFAAFCDAITGFPMKWHLRNERRKSILMVCHYPDLAVLLMIGRTTRGKFASISQKHYPDLGSDFSSVWNFCTFFSDLISRGNQWWHHKILPVLWGQIHAGLQKQWKGKVWGSSYAFFRIYICILNCLCVPAFNESCVGKQINLQS